MQPNPASLARYARALSFRAFDPRNSVGRRDPRSLNVAIIDHLNPFLLDKNALLNSKAVRRLSGKTQVVTAPSNTHIRTRRVHVDEVIAIAVTVSEILGLNTHLCEAIALGHDIGHTPYGHLGEEIISELADPLKFRHEHFGVVVAQDIERKGFGLNLTGETLLGILHHSSGGCPNTESRTDLPQEIFVVRFADKVSYTFADPNDINRLGFFSDTPQLGQEMEEMLSWFGSNQRARVMECIASLVEESSDQRRVSFAESKTAVHFKALRDWMYKKVYRTLDRQFHRDAFRMVYMEVKKLFSNPLAVMALLTDREIGKLVDAILQDGIGLTLEHFRGLGIMEIVPYLENVDIFHSDLSWLSERYRVDR